MPPENDNIILSFSIMVVKFSMKVQKGEQIIIKLGRI